MATQIFVNLPVKDLKRSMDFFSHLGYSFNPDYTDDKAACMVISDTIYVMLLTEAFFQSFSKKEIPDTGKSAEVILCLSAESRASVDDMVRKAEQAGGLASGAPRDHGWMYQHGFQDADGHLWEVAYMDTEALERYKEEMQKAQPVAS